MTGDPPLNAPSLHVKLMIWSVVVVGSFAKLIGASGIRAALITIVSESKL